MHNIVEYVTFDISPGNLDSSLCFFQPRFLMMYSAAAAAAAAAKSLQSCPTLRDPMDCSLPGSSVHGISQARVLEWVAIALSCKLMKSH